MSINEREKSTSRCKIKRLLLKQNEEGTYKDALHKQAK